MLQVNKPKIVFFSLSIVAVLALFFLLDSNKISDKPPLSLPDKESSFDENGINSIEIIDTNDPDIIVVRSTSVPYVDPDPSKLLTNWLEESGYQLFDLFVPIEIVKAVPNINLTSDYQSYNLGTLKELSENGDHNATFFYAMNLLETDSEAAVIELEKTVVEAGYTASIHQIALAYNSEAQIEIMKSNISHSKETEIQTNEDYVDNTKQKKSSNELTDNQLQSYVWLLTGLELNDPLSQEVLKNISMDNLNEQTKNRIKDLAIANVERINSQRTNLGLKELVAQENDDDIINFANKRLGN